MVEVKVYKISSNIDNSELYFQRNDDVWTIDSEFDASDYLLDEDIVIEDELELGSAFELKVGGVDLNFMYDDSLHAYLTDHTYITTRNKGYALSISIDGLSVYWGSIEKHDTSSELIGETIEIESSNFYKFWIDSIGFKRVQGFDRWNPTQNVGTIAEYLPYFTSSGTESSDEIKTIKGVELLVGNAPINLNFYDLLRFDQNPMTVKELFTEIQKQYGAFFYIDHNRVLKVVNRGYISSVPAMDVDDIISDEEDLLKYHEEDTYDSIVTNVDYLANIGGYYGGIVVGVDDWVLLYEDNGNQGLLLEGDMENIPPEFNYLDLRQKATWNADSSSYESTRDWMLFKPDNSISSGFTQEMMWFLYKNITHTTEVIECAVLGTDLFIYDTVTYDSNDYTVFSTEKNYTNEITKLKLKRVI